MENYKINLKEAGYPVEGGELESIAYSRVWDDETLAQNWKRPAVIVVPGGSYAFVSKREGEPIAGYFLAKGYQTFVLTYLISGDGVSYPEQLFELASAVDYVKKNAEKFHVNPEEVFVVGFSAGGHLTANLAVDYFNVSKRAGVELDCKPTAVGLSYPVINKFGHEGSFMHLLNGYTDEAKSMLEKELSLDECVTAQTAPSFVWTTAADAVVNPLNSIDYARACALNKVPYELHVYPQGGHGLGSCDPETNVPQACLDKNSGWIENCLTFFRLFVKENI